MQEQTRGDYAVRLGDRLRNVRQQQRLSLHDVETASGGELKASVVGAYERGERAISVSRLRTLADFYGVPVAQILPGDGPRVEVQGPGTGGLRIDLARLQLQEGRAAEVVARYVDAIQVRRGDFNGRILTIRSGDLQALAAVLNVAPDDLRAELRAAGVATAVA